ncbi:hypothetical protein HOG21_01220 [bacterium]|jgi:hypothetical protein|nr:hypothetical protein [bacterium]
MLKRLTRKEGYEMVDCLMELTTLSTDKAKTVVDRYNESIDYANVHNISLCESLKLHCLYTYKLLYSSSIWEYPDGNMLVYIKNCNSY